VRRVTERDREIIATVALHGAASRAQLMDLGHFSSPSRANRRLRLLWEAKYLRRAFIATGPHQNETIYVLGPAGATIAAEDCNLELVQLKRQASRAPERMYLEHHLLVLSVRLQAREVSGNVRLVDFLSEPECRHEYVVVSGSRKARRLIKPDAVAIFERAGEQLPVFIEVDRGHVSLPQMSGVFERYGHYWADGAFAAADYGNTDIPFTVAVITTAGPRRIYHLMQLAKRVPVLVRFANFADVRSNGLLGAMWFRANDGEPGGLWDDLGGLTG
jgi:hypothetical protein